MSPSAMLILEKSPHLQGVSAMPHFAVTRQESRGQGRDDRQRHVGSLTSRGNEKVSAERMRMADGDEDIPLDLDVEWCLDKMDSL